MSNECPAGQWMRRASRDNGWWQSRTGQRSMRLTPELRIGGNPGRRGLAPIGADRENRGTGPSDGGLGVRFFDRISRCHNELLATRGFENSSFDLPLTFSYCDDEA